MRWITAIPIYNEATHLAAVLREAQRYSDELLVVDDGSTDGSGDLLRREPDIRLVSHERNQGYGAALKSAFDYAVAGKYDVLVTMDCDGQHEPGRIPVLLEALTRDIDIVSGSRYLRDFKQDTPVPEERLAINKRLTAEINDRYGLNITDAFCGFKAYHVAELSKLRITEAGWGMPLQLWVQAARLGLRVREVGVPRLYIDATRSFGHGLDDAERRLAYYKGVLDAAEREFPAGPLPAYCSAGVVQGACS